MQKNAKKRLSTFSRVMVGVLAVLILLSAALTILERAGLTLKYARVRGYLTTGIVASAFVWGIVALRRRIKTQTWRMTIGILGAVIGFVAVFFVYYYFSGFILNLECSEHYALIEENGHKVEVMYNMIPDGETFEAKYGGQTENGLIPEDCYFYVFVAYPLKGGLFLETKGYTYPLIPGPSPADGGGDVPYVATWPGEDGKPHLLMEWKDGDTLRLYAEEPIKGGNEIVLDLSGK